ncbi:uncharacterized protein TNCV_977041 [Trichonephila clavipes]|nr:uncharacterized protein TNCV_977041 [Trichonephila clavipes]
MMSDSETEIDSTSTKLEVSFKSRSSTSTRSETSNPTTPASDCSRRRQAITRLKQQDLLIEEYKIFLDYQKTIKDETSISNDIIRNIQETKEARDRFAGYDSLGVKVLDRRWHVTSLSPVPLKTRREGERCTFNLLRAQTSSLWCGEVVRRGVPAQESSSSLNHGSKGRGPSPKALL